MDQIDLTIKHPAGLHARPASEFVQLANRFTANISVSYHGKVVSAKSILGVLTLGAADGAEIQISAEGPDAQDALSALRGLVESGFASAG